MDETFDRGVVLVRGSGAGYRTLISEIRIQTRLI